MSNWVPRLDDSGMPKYLAIADAIDTAIRDGTLRPGQRLPPQRKLAAALGLDFTTVSRGYSEAQARGLVDSHVGRGTFVRSQTPASPTLAFAPADRERATCGDLSMNMPPEPDDPELIGRMQSGLSYVASNLIPLLRYQSPMLAEPDRATCADWLAQRGLTPPPDRMAITTGAHAAMAGILRMLAKPGDVVLCEELTYPGFRTIAAQLGVGLIGLPMDDDGLLPDGLAQAIAAHGPRALYLNPTLHNPTTITMSDARRREIAALLRRHSLPLIEDDAYGFVPDDPPAPLAVHAPDQTWYIGGLSKCIGAGLRLAYVAAPTARDAYALGQAARAQPGMPPPMSMALVMQWTRDGTAQAIRQFIRRETQARQAIAAEMLKDVAYRSGEGAFNLWLTLPGGARPADIVARMAGQPIGVLPADPFSVGSGARDCLRVGLGGSVSRGALRDSLAFLSHALLPGTYMG